MLTLDIVRATSEYIIYVFLHCISTKLHKHLDDVIIYMYVYDECCSKARRRTDTSAGRVTGGQCRTRDG